MTRPRYVPLISIDLETTSLDPEHGAPWEIAWVTAIHDTDGGVIDSMSAYHSFLELPATAALNPVSLTVGRFYDRWAEAQAKAWHAVQPVLFKHLKDVKARTLELNLDHHDGSAAETAVHLLGAVPQFDHRMLERWLGWVHPWWHYHFIDVETLLAGAAGMCAPFDTNELTAVMQQRLLLDSWDSSRMHEAMHDVRWNFHLYAAAYHAALAWGVR